MPGGRTTKPNPSEAELLEELRLANAAAAEAKERIQAAVNRARDADVTWAKIATALGLKTPAQAQNRFSEEGREKNKARVQRYQQKNAELREAAGLARPKKRATKKAASKKTAPAAAKRRGKAI